MEYKEKKINQSQKILLTAFECISSKGYANTSMRDIADAAEVALSQLNYHYKNKEGLFIEVINFTIREYLQGIERHICLGKSPKEKISNLLIYFRGMLEKNPKSFRLLYDFTSMALWHPTFGETLKNLFNDISGLIEKNILKDNQLKNNIRRYSSKDISRMLSGAMFGIAIQVLLDPMEKELPSALNAIELVFDN
ncbi:MAG: TetR/AcrR family transcriptional regulator [Mobilitalea sp.]